MSRISNNDPKQSALAVFEALSQGLLYNINAADLYLHHLLSAGKEQVIDNSLVRALLSENRISGQFVIRENFPEKDYEATKVRMIPIVNQLLVATWTVVEVYLKAKFEELLRHKYAGSDSHLIDLALKDLNVQTFDRLKDNYVDYLCIFLTQYDLDTIFETRNRTIDDYVIKEITSACTLLLVDHANISSVNVVIFYRYRTS